MLRRRYWRLVFAFGVLGLSPLAHAAGDAQRGREIVQRGGHAGVVACSACHGLGGEGNREAGYPVLAGLPASYLAYQLESFKQGMRNNPVMAPIAKAMSAQEMNDAAAWYASQPRKTPPATGKVSAATLERGKQLANIGAWKQGVPSCFSCHGANGEGVAPHFPPIAGQYANYLVAQLQAFKNGQRHNDQNGLMRSVAQHLSTTDMQAISDYLAEGPSAVKAGGNGAPGKSGAKEAAGKDHATSDAAFTPPSDSQIPHDPFGDMVRLGENIFVNTQKYAKQYVGDGLNCSNCHLDRGRKADSAPMWAAYVYYPAYRSKNKKVNTMQDRISGCFRFSENGTPPPVASKEMTALVTYFSWLARGAPSNTKMKQHNYPKLAKAAQKPSAERGARVYAQQCAYCHGDQGQGTMVNGQFAFPPLWGAKSYNWGAGMHNPKNAAAFVKYNMPYGKGGSLSDQDAWDVATFVDSHPRPPDPRKLKRGQSRHMAVPKP